MVQGGVDVVAATIGTGVTETQLNGAAAVILPDPVREICEIVPWQVSNAATTAAEDAITQIRMQSNDVPNGGIEPKRFLADTFAGGLGATAVSLAPMLRARSLNIRTKGGERINVFGTSQVAQTVAPLVGATLICTESQSGMPESFYEKPDNETNTGTTVNTRTAGNAITVSNVGSIVGFEFTLGNLVQTAAESVAGTIEFAGSDLNTSMPQIYSVQPSMALRGATGNILKIANTQYKLIEPIHPKSRGTLTISNFFTNRVVFTAAGNFITGIKFYH